MYIEAFLNLLVECERQGFTVTRSLMADAEGEQAVPAWVVARGTGTEDAGVILVGMPTTHAEWWALVASLIAIGLEWPPLRERN